MVPYSGFLTFGTVRVRSHSKWQSIVDKHIVYENERYFTGKSYLLRATKTNNGALQWVLDFWYSYGKDPQQVVAPFI